MPRVQTMQIARDEKHGAQASNQRSIAAPLPGYGTPFTSRVEQRRQHMVPPDSSRITIEDCLKVRVG